MGVCARGRSHKAPLSAGVECMCAWQITSEKLGRVNQCLKRGKLQNSAVNVEAIRINTELAMPAMAALS